VSVVARYSRGEPAIVEKKLGRGKVLLFNTTADKEWSDFPLRPAFVPVVKRAIQHVTLGRRPPKNTEVHSRAVEFVAASEAGGRVTVRDPRGGVRQVAARLSRDGDIALVEYARLHFAGFYELTREGAQERSYFAANPPPGESDLDSLTGDELASRYPHLEFNWIEGGEGLARAMREQRVGTETWPVFMALVLACLIAETLLALKWAPREA
jgi:hypothetical protein